MYPQSTTALSCLLALLLFSFTGFGQTTFPVTHTSGTQLINGISVTVTSYGETSTYNSCGAGPYWAGEDNSDGAYIFHFSPAVNAVELDYAVINGANTTGMEEIRHFVNGSHRPITSVGMANGCDNLAILTAAGDIGGVSNADEYGWNGTLITGPIHSIRVLNKVVSGNPWGTVFSLTMLPNYVNVLTPTSVEALVYPNPTQGRFALELSGLALNTHPHVCEVFNSLGTLVYSGQMDSTRKEIDLSTQAPGIYMVQLRSESRVLAVEKVVVY